MKQLLGCLALVGAMTSLPTAQAEFVLDDFDSATSPGVAGASRVVTTSGGYSGFYAGSALLISGSATPTGFYESTVTYGIPVAAPILGYNHFLALRGLAVFGDWELTVTATGDGTVPGEATFSLPDGSTDDVFDLVALSNVGNLNNLTELSLRFTALAPDINGNRTLRIAQIAAVPEPTSIALLGLTGLGGVIVARRRRKVAEVSEVA